MNLKASLIRACVAFSATALVLACSDAEPDPPKAAPAKPPVARTAPVIKPAPKTVKEQLETFVEIPSHYPDDAPVYPNTKPNTAGFHNGRMTASFHTTDGVDEVLTFTREFLGSKGWSKISEAELPGTTIIEGFKNDRSISVLISTLEDGGRTVTIIVVAVDLS